MSETRQGSGGSGRGAMLLPALVLLGLVGSLLYRVWQRGPYYPGWDILGPARGLNMFSRFPPDEAFFALLRGVSQFRYWNSTNSIVYTVVPGNLSRLLPCEYWGHGLTFVLVLVTFWLIQRFAALPARHVWFLGLAWGASSALLSFSVAGYPYATGFLPHALALVIVATPWMRARPLVSFIVALFVTELSWHLYEAGKTLIVVFVIAALIERSAPLATRAGWLAASAVQLLRLLEQRGFNVDYVMSGAKGGSRALTGGAARVVEALSRPEVDLPLIVPLGLVAFFFIRRHRLLLLGGLVSQVVTVVLAASVEPTAALPRRMLTTTFYGLTVIAVAFAETAREGGRRLFRLALVTTLVAGNLWQMTDLWLFYRVSPAGRTHPLPFTWSPNDYFVAADATDVAGEVRAEIARGRPVFLLYNLSSETLADPKALLERVYLTTDHERFVRSVFTFGAKRCRYDCLPIRPLEDLKKDLSALAGASHGAVAFYSKALKPRRHVEESTLALMALTRDFSIHPELEPVAGFGRLELAPRSSAPLPIVVESATEPLPLNLAWLPDPRVSGGVVRASPNRDGPFRFVWSASAAAADETSVDLLLGCDGTLRLSLDATEVIVRTTAGFTIWRERVRVPGGRQTLRLEYQSRTASGRLLLQLDTPDRVRAGRSK